MSDPATNTNFSDTERRALILEGATGEMSKRLDDIHADIKELRGSTRDDNRELRADIKANAEATQAALQGVQTNIIDVQKSVIGVQNSVISVQNSINLMTWRLLGGVLLLLIANGIIDRVFP